MRIARSPQAVAMHTSLSVGLVNYTSVRDTLRIAMVGVLVVAPMKIQVVGDMTPWRLVNC